MNPALTNRHFGVYCYLFYQKFIVPNSKTQFFQKETFPVALKMLYYSR